MKKLLFLYLLIFTGFPMYSQILDNGNFTFHIQAGYLQIEKGKIFIGQIKCN